jgi:hypothetical protein
MTAPRYRLVTRWRVKATPDERPAAATGDFNGTGRWTIEADDDDTVVDYAVGGRGDEADSALRVVSAPAVVRGEPPLAMARGEESLRRELARRRRAPVSVRSAGEPTEPGSAER